MSGLKVFCDYHHGDLFYSLQLLFEKRLGAELYRSIGLEWAEQGFWNVFPHPATQEQYLGLAQTSEPRPLGLDGLPFPKEQLMNLNYRVEDGIHYVMDPSHNKIQRAIRLEKFKQMKFDIIISSMPPHIEPYNRLIELYQPQAKHIFQVGNAWTHLPGVKNILSSTAPFPVANGVNACFYHQEFDLDVYKYQKSTKPMVVNSYVHLMKELDLLAFYKQLLPDYTFTTYGASMDSIVHGAQNMANTMMDSGWTWHVKPEGDGYGHVLHSTYACGRPTIIKANYYAGKVGSYLLEDGVTCIDISKRDPMANAQLIREWSQPDKHQVMCQNAYNRFCEVVDYDKEEQEIRRFLENLK